MAQISVKYKCGASVGINHGTAKTKGVVTAIHVRGRGRAYEVAYTDKDGPKCVNCEEIELVPWFEGTEIGF